MGLFLIKYNTLDRGVVAAKIAKDVIVNRFEIASSRSARPLLHRVICGRNDAVRKQDA